MSKDLCSKWPFNQCRLGEGLPIMPDITGMSGPWFEQEHSHFRMNGPVRHILMEVLNSAQQCMCPLQIFRGIFLVKSVEFRAKWGR